MSRGLPGDKKRRECPGRGTHAGRQGGKRHLGTREAHGRPWAGAELIRHKGPSGGWRSRQGRDKRDLEGCTKGALKSTGLPCVQNYPPTTGSLGHGLILEFGLFDDFHETLFPV